MRKLREPKVEEMIARIVVSKPSKYLPQFLDHWSQEQNLPDLSDGRVPKPDRLQFWKNLKCCAGLHAHCDLSGLCRKWCHIAFDFAISRNQWPVIFHKQTESNQLYDMTVPFTLTAWVCYCAQMNGSPALKSKACQKVCVLKTSFVFQNLVLCFETLWTIYGLNVDTLFVFLKPPFVFQNLLLCFETPWMIYGLNGHTLFVFLKRFLHFKIFCCVLKHHEWFMVWIDTPRLCFWNPSLHFKTFLCVLKHHQWFMVWMETPVLFLKPCFALQNKSSFVFWSDMHDLWFEWKHPVCVFETLVCISKSSLVLRWIANLLTAFWKPHLHFKIHKGSHVYVGKP